MLHFKTKFKYLVVLTAGILVGALAFGGAVFAVSDQYTLSLFKTKFVFNGVEKQGSNTPYMVDNGKFLVPAALLYNGTTYVPLTFFSNAAGQPVKYDGKTQTIFVGKMPAEDQVESYMSDIIQPYYSDKEIDCSSMEPMTMAGNEYTKGYKIGSDYWDFSGDKVSFNLNGKFHTIKGLIGLDDDDNKSDIQVAVYGDDRWLAETSLIHGELPHNWSIDVTGVSKLEFKVTGSGQLDFVNIMIQ